MEDAATAEISRAQIWQWKYHGVKTEDDGVVITAKRISKLVHEEVKRRTGGQEKGKWFLAGKLVSNLLWLCQYLLLLACMLKTSFLSTHDIIPQNYLRWRTC